MAECLVGNLVASLVLQMVVRKVDETVELSVVKKGD